MADIVSNDVCRQKITCFLSCGHFHTTRFHTTACNSQRFPSPCPHTNTEQVSNWDSPPDLYENSMCAWCRGDDEFLEVYKNNRWRSDVGRDVLPDWEIQTRREYWEMRKSNQSPEIARELREEKDRDFQVLRWRYLFESTNFNEDDAQMPTYWSPFSHQEAAIDDLLRDCRKKPNIREMSAVAKSECGEICHADDEFESQDSDDNLSSNSSDYTNEEHLDLYEPKPKRTKAKSTAPPAIAPPKRPRTSRGETIHPPETPTTDSFDQDTHSRALAPTRPTVVIPQPYPHTQSEAYTSEAPPTEPYNQLNHSEGLTPTHSHSSSASPLEAIHTTYHSPYDVSEFLQIGHFAQNQTLSPRTIASPQGYFQNGGATLNPGFDYPYTQNAFWNHLRFDDWWRFTNQFDFGVTAGHFQGLQYTPHFPPIPLTPYPSGMTTPPLPSSLFGSDEDEELEGGEVMEAFSPGEEVEFLRIFRSPEEEAAVLVFEGCEREIMELLPR
ncbi:hypothetical protein B0J14DRAFT_648421 [Halenospora varia]|nr:hypothetical protein B0J14DRAFT_648421 [Halenospora varia]